MNNKRTGAIATGILAIAAGIFLYMFNAGLLDPAWKRIVFSWQSLLIAIGFISAVSRNVFAGAVLMIIGGFFILPKFAYVTPFIKDNLWTLILIAAGVLLILKGVFSDRCVCRKKERDYKKRCTDRAGRVAGDDRAGYVVRNHVFGGGKEKCELTPFRGGEINCVFGGTEIDLRGSTLNEGVNFMEVNCVFGGITLIVPREWKVELHQSGVFGRFSDNRYGVETTAADSPALVVKASSVFGGGEIRNV